MPRKLDNQFSWKNATFMAKLSTFAYSGEKEFKKVFSKQWKDITFVSKGGTECYILTCPKNYKDFIKEYGLGYNALYLKPMAALNPLRKKENVKKVKENGSKKSKEKS